MENFLFSIPFIVHTISSDFHLDGPLIGYGLLLQRKAPLYIILFIHYLLSIVEYDLFEVECALASALCDTIRVYLSSQNLGHHIKSITLFVRRDTKADLPAIQVTHIKHAIAFIHIICIYNLIVLCYFFLYHNHFIPIHLSLRW